MKAAVGLVIVACGLFGDSVATGVEPSLAVRAREVLKERCHACHKGPNSKGGHFNALVHNTMVIREAGKEAGVVVPGKLQESALWQLVESGEMPLAGSDQRAQFLSKPAEKEILKRWIEAGAPEWHEQEAKPARSFIPVSQMLSLIRDDLAAQQNQGVQVEFLRYFTLIHLNNQPAEQVSDEDLELYRAALSKAINSLSWNNQPLIPRAIDPGKMIFAIDLRELKWEQLWNQIVASYPYGLTYEKHGDLKYRIPYVDIVRLSRSELPFIRGDWFAATATRPPLYFDLLKLPKTDTELETRLDVNIPENFKADRLMRAGFARSKISPQANRLLERHDESYGGYWKSYDFRAGAPLSQLPLYPLGPKFNGNKFAHFAFEQGGGEIIFNLPNGLQGYFVVNGKGERLDAAPTAIVSDPRRISGAPDIVTGVSCIACHTEGMKGDFKDAILLGTPVEGEALLKVQHLYPPPNVLEAKLEQDRQRFLNAQFKVISPFLQGRKPGPDNAYSDLPEPIGRINEYYRLDRLSATTAAAELGLPDANQLVENIRHSRPLRELGLGPLTVGGDINRADWESTIGTSIFQRAARELDLGTPFSP